MVVVFGGHMFNSFNDSNTITDVERVEHKEPSYYSILISMHRKILNIIQKDITVYRNCKAMFILIKLNNKSCF